MTLQKRNYLDIYYSFQLWTFEIFNLASEVKFDLGGQKSSELKVAYLTKRLCIEEVVLISIRVSDLWTYEIFSLASEVKFGLGDSLFLHFT